VDWIYQNGNTCVRVKRTHVCGLELQQGQLALVGLDQLHWQGWMCPKHGEVKPDYRFVDRSTLGGGKLETIKLEQTGG